MKEFFEKAKQLIQELIFLRHKQSDWFIKLERKKDSTATQFKIKNYMKWVVLLDTQINNNSKINTISDIKTLKFTEKLEAKLCELFDNGDIKDIEETKLDINKLEKEYKNKNSHTSDTTLNSNNSSNSNSSNSSNTEANLSNSIVSVDSSIDDTDELIMKETENETDKTTKSIKKLESVKLEPNKKQKTDKDNKTNTNSSKINTTNLESIPKIMASIPRPTDTRGGSIYDLQLLHGVGPKSAIQLYEKGITLEGLMKEWTDLITRNPNYSILLTQKMGKPSDYTTVKWNSIEYWQKQSILDTHLKNTLENETKLLCKIHKSTLVGLKYFHDITQKIPREEIIKAETILTRVAEHMNKDIKVMLCGSYRRGRDKSGDIDCCLFHPVIKTLDDIKTNKYNILANFVEMLINVDFIIDQLDMGLQKFMGMCMIKQPNKKHNVARRLDIRFMPYDSYGSAILYFTGSANFNTDVRKIAIGKGYSLSEFGFKNKNDNTLIPCATEEDVFKFLNIPYKTPKERDI